MPRALPFVKADRLLETRGAHLRVGLRGVDARMAEQAAHLLEVAVLFVDFHRHAVAEIVWLELRVADQPPVRLAEPYDDPRRCL